ncbi:helix-turn-helix transcriptional regulator [Leucobacter weissii]|uniref:Helix-turn-helix transcriptional regulator n=2 Tax=Leucobacter weissii TaxID=1983706 RepID=A0A939ML07_9MICO|nr:helix-turn-helix transcriptional regulator [Leucobacter weissii]
MRTAYVVAALSSDGPERFPGLGRQFDDARDGAYRPDLVTYFHARSTWQYLRGDIRDAHRLAERALATSEYLDPSGVGAAVVAILAETAALLGERDRASALLSRFRRTPSRASGLVDGSSEAHVASAMLLLGAAEASSSIARASERHAAAGGFGSAADVLRTGVRFGRRRSARALLRISDRLDGELHRMSADHARALLADDALALWSVAERLAQAGLRLWSAEAAAAAANVAGAPAALRRRAIGHCRAYAEEQPLPGHPLLRLSGPAQPALTRREREVSDLIAAGLSNDEIAARLRLSLRTVEGHVSRLYRKTGAVRRSPARRSASQE